ncbi:hypothetical protein [Paenibacillus jiagnxiensis]|uniref:hypothetical protein n=1 Tax=Paenibacillus jiagnxiensis TaxID=3228926 RepID=UPI0033AC78C6
MDIALDIGGLSRANRELKYTSGYLESLRKRKEIFKAEDLARKKNLIDRITESINRLTFALERLARQLYYVNQLARRFPGIRFGGKLGTTIVQHPKNANIPKSDDKVSPSRQQVSSNKQNESNRSIGALLTKPFQLSNVTAVNTNNTNVPAKSGIDLTWAILATDIAEGLKKTVDGFKSITAQQFTSMSTRMQSIYTYLDGIGTKITSSSIFTKISSMWSSSPAWLKTSAKFAGATLKVLDGIVSVFKIGNAKGEKKYEELFSTALSLIGGSAGARAGAGAGLLVPGAELVTVPLFAALGGIVGGFAGKWAGGWIGKGVWHVKENLGGWTSSFLENVDSFNASFSTGVDNINETLNNKVDQLIPQATSQLDSWLSDTSTNVNKGSNLLTDALGNFNSFLSSNNSPLSPLVNEWTPTIQNGIGDISNNLVDKINSIDAANVVNEVGESAKKFLDSGAKVSKNGADAVSSGVKFGAKGLSDYVQMIVDLPEKFDFNFNPWGLFSLNNNTDVNGTKKIGTSTTRTASSKSYRANEKHTQTATTSVKNSNRTTANTNVNMPQGAVQVSVGQPVNLAELALQVGQRFVTEYKRATENKRTATV